MLSLIRLSNSAGSICTARSSSSSTPSFSATDVAVSEGVAYVADGSSGLQLIDVSGPTDVSLLGAYDTPAFALGIAAEGNYAFVADQWSGLQVIDVSDPATIAGLLELVMFTLALRGHSCLDNSWEGRHLGDYTV